MFVTKVWKARVFVWVVGVCLCGRRCRCGCVSAWVSCCSECFCRLHVDTCRCIVPHDSTNVSIRQHTSRLHVDTCRCIVPDDSTNVSIRHVCMLTHAVASSHMTAENSIGIAQNCIRKTAQSLCVCVWPLVCLCGPLCVCVSACGPCVSVCGPISIADTHATLHLTQNSICIFIYASGTKQQHALHHESDDGQTRSVCHKPGIAGTRTTWSSSA